eukprot:Clim_evm3s240 gene=Clim_evmTU3s240
MAARIPIIEKAVDAVFALPGMRGVYSAMSKWAINASGYRKYGLTMDDILMEDDNVREAIRRLPANEIDERNFRHKIAIDCSMKHQILPKDQQTTDETDRRYLKDILAQVEKESDERDRWDVQ